MTPADFPRARKIWKAVLEAAGESARAPLDDAAAIAFKRVLRGQGVGSFPLEVRDSRGKAVGAFIALAGFWVDAGGTSRTAFASSLAAMARDLEVLLRDQALGEFEASMTRQRLD